MKKFIRTCLVIVLIALGCGIIWQILQPREPEYEGKKLTFWLETCIPGRESKEAEQKLGEVMSKVGTNAIPTLLRKLRERDSALRVKWNKSLDWLDTEYAVKIDHPVYWERNYEGYLGFQKLGGEAANAVPQLIKIYDANISSESRSGVVLSLGTIGPQAKKRDTKPAKMVGRQFQFLRNNPSARRNSFRP